MPNLSIFIFILFFSSTIFSQSFDAATTEKTIIELLDNDPKKALQEIQLALKQKQIIQIDSLFYKFRLLKAEALDQLGIFDESLKILYTLLGEIEDQAMDARLGPLYNQIGLVYFQMNDQKKYLEFEIKSKSVSIKNKMYNDTFSINSEIGLALAGNKRFVESFEMQLNNLMNARKFCQNSELIAIIDNLSNTYNEYGDYKNAIKYQLELLDFPEINSSLDYKAGVNQHLAELYINNEDFKKAVAHVDIAIKYAQEMGSNDWLFDCYKNKSDILARNGDYKNALHYFKEYRNARDSVYNENYDIKMSTLHNLYELDSKTNQITLLEKDKLLNKRWLELLIAACIILIISSLLYYFFITNRKNIFEKNIKSKFAEQLLTGQEEERQRIAQELHDSIGQNLLFIKNQMLNPSVFIPGKILESLNDTIEDVRNISKNLYPNQLEKYGLAASLQALADQVTNSTGIYMSADVENIDQILTKNVKINFYRIVQEFLNNSMKHAKATSIRVTAQQIGNEVHLIVQDNGIGFDVDKIMDKTTQSFGILNMEERIKMLKGKLSIESQIGKGTKSTFIIPV